MFGLFKKKIDCKIYSPVDGECIPIDQCGDQMFSEKLLGEGVAFRLKDGILYAPCDGVVSAIANTKHAYGIRSNNGTEILVHVGFETNGLNGEGFTSLVSQDDKVKKGQKILEVDLSFVESKGLTYVTALVITNSNDYNVTIYNMYGDVSPDTVLIHTQKNTM